MCYIMIVMIELRLAFFIGQHLNTSKYAYALKKCLTLQAFSHQTGIFGLMFDQCSDLVATLTQLGEPAEHISPLPVTHVTPVTDELVDFGWDG